MNIAAKGKILLLLASAAVAATSHARLTATYTQPAGASENRAPEKFSQAPELRLDLPLQPLEAHRVEFAFALRLVPEPPIDPDGRIGRQALWEASAWAAATEDFGLNMVIGGGAMLSCGLDWGMTAVTGRGWMGGGTHLHAQGDAFMAAMNPLQQFGYYQPGSYEAQARNAAELVAVAASGGAALNNLASIGDDLTRLGSNFKLPELSLTFESRMGGRQMNPSQAGMLDLSTATSNTPKLFDVIPYSTAAPGFERHHGVLDAWARANVSGYTGSTSPTMVLTADLHNATRAVFNTWRAERGMARQAIDWTRVSAQEAHSLSYRMSRAAGAPDEAVETYFRAFNRHLYGN